MSINGLKFPAAVEVAFRALRLLRDNLVEPIGGHVVGASVTFVVDVADFDKLAARGELADIKVGRQDPLNEISFHATVTHVAMLVSLPDVRMMATAIVPMATAHQVPEPQLWDGAPPEPAPAPASDPDTRPVAFGS